MLFGLVFNVILLYYVVDSKNLTTTLMTTDGGEDMLYDEDLYYDEESMYLDSEANNTTDILGFGEIGGVGQLIYHLFCFKDYEVENTDKGIIAHPICRPGFEPELVTNDMPTGKELLVSLYNLAKRINDFSEDEPYTDLIIEWCKTYSHPYFIDFIYSYLSDKQFDVSEDSLIIEKDGIFSINDFMKDLERFYQAAEFYFALEHVCLGYSDAAYNLFEDGKHFAGLPFFEKYKHDPEEQPQADYSTANGDLVKEMQLDSKINKSSGNKREHSDCCFAREPYDFYDELRDILIDIIPDFNMRLKVNPKTNQVVFSADVHSVFDICWYTLARKITEDEPPEKKGLKKKKPEGTVVSCLCCGEAFIRSNNRQRYCGKKECDLARRAKNQRENRARKRIEKVREGKRE